ELLVHGRGWSQLGEIDVVVAMAAGGMPLALDAPGDLRPVTHLGTHQKEGRLDLGLLEDREDLIRIDRIRSVVECQRDRLVLALAFQEETLRKRARLAGHEILETPQRTVDVIAQMGRLDERQEDQDEHSGNGSMR